jgi:hypothetical protein
VQGNDGYLYLFIDEQTPYIWKKVQIGVKAVGNILQSDHVFLEVMLISVPENRIRGPIHSVFTFLEVAHWIRSFSFCLLLLILA